MNVNNNLDENVADSGGLFLAVQAFNTWLLHHPQSKNQTFLNSQWKEFFLAFAQVCSQPESLKQVILFTWAFWRGADYPHSGVKIVALRYESWPWKHMGSELTGCHWIINKSTKIVWCPPPRLNGVMIEKFFKISSIKDLIAAYPQS